MCRPLASTSLCRSDIPVERIIDSEQQYNKPTSEYVLWGKTKRLVRDTVCDQSPFCPGIETWLFYIAFEADSVKAAQEKSHERL